MEDIIFRSHTEKCKKCKFKDNDVEANPCCYCVHGMETEDYFEELEG